MTHFNIIGNDFMTRLACPSSLPLWNRCGMISVHGSTHLLLILYIWWMNRNCNVIIPHLILFSLRLIESNYGQADIPQSPTARTA